MTFYYSKPKEKTLYDRFLHACFASMNAASSLALASMALGHFNIQVCAEFKDTSSFREGTSFCLPTAHSIKYAKQFDSFSSENLGSFSQPFLDFSAGVAGILSLYFAKQAYRQFKEVF